MTGANKETTESKGEVNESGQARALCKGHDFSKNSPEKAVSSKCCHRPEKHTLFMAFTRELLLGGQIIAKQLPARWVSNHSGLPLESSDYWAT